MSQEASPHNLLNKGTFLIASPEITSGFFFRSVILLCEHSSAGSFGLIVNKPLNIEMPEEINQLGPQNNPNIFLKAGGPLQPNQMMLLHNDPNLTDQTLELTPSLFLGGDVEFLNKAMITESGPSVFLCFGYTGWTAGFLEKEYLDGMWFLTKGNSDQLFNTPPEKLWQTILREMGGKYATLSMIPEDLSLN
ncbi:MAG: YqgE/AlgH family protein [Simkaniaceae bacterium]